MSESSNEVMHALSTITNHTAQVEDQGHLNDYQMNGVAENSNQTGRIPYSAGSVSESNVDVPIVPRRHFAARKLAPKFDYGIMNFRKEVILTSENHVDMSQALSGQENELPKDFTLAIKMLSLRDVWEEALSSTYYYFTSSFQL